MAEADQTAFTDDYLPALLAQASQLISSEFHQVVRKNGVSVSEWRVLATLSGVEPMSSSRVAQISVTKQPTLTRLLDRLEKKGQIERLPHSSDRRVTLVRITPAGRRKVARLIALAKEHELRVLEPFGLPNARELKQTLRRMIDLHRPRESETA
jgi:DNA-binding MarR family transcriptional regulator